MLVIGGKPNWKRIIGYQNKRPTAIVQSCLD